MGMDQVPHNLGQALDELERDDVLCSALGESYAKTYISAKREEWDSYLDATSATVSQWEIDRYL
jgi:glutamine synthetase